MRQVFLSSPWIHPEDPAPLRTIIETLGHPVSVTAGTALPHADGLAYVGLLEKGLGCIFPRKTSWHSTGVSRLTFSR